MKRSVIRSVVDVVGGGATLGTLCMDLCAMAVRALVSSRLLLLEYLKKLKQSVVLIGHILDMCQVTT
ncbi:hypothetical protein [Paenibacillus polymyxa]|uniref:Uncharacterized protein n=1 Tax=Paenibacillus polymyxa TaxID=1406 RepID=A0AAP4A4G7_PAEPO|nr:hypothetical protein [Paenibacillus polymyxa]MDH2332489.1 hypothetical protein [Paenibacillus polymyxa]